MTEIRPRPVCRTFGKLLPIGLDLHNCWGISVKTASLIAASLMVVTLGVSQAAEFGVTTHIYKAAGRIPIVSCNTVFTGQKVFDVTTSHPRKATIIDYQAGTIDIFSPQHQVKLRLSTQDVLRYSAYFKSHGEFRGELMQFLKEPKFTSEFTPENQTLSMAGGPLRYDVAVARTENRPAVDEYARFCDWAAQLNFVCAGGSPPAARIEVNARLRSQSVLPQEIRKTILGAEPSETVTLRSTHEYRWLVSDEDRALIQSLEQDMAEAKSVNLREFVEIISAK